MSSRPDTFVSLLSPFLAKLRRRFTFSPFKNPGCTLPVNLLAHSRLSDRVSAGSVTNSGTCGHGFNCWHRTITDPR